jgi:hypothetical protein
MISGDITCKMKKLDLLRWGGIVIEDITSKMTFYTEIEEAKKCVTVDITLALIFAFFCMVCILY